MPEGAYLERRKRIREQLNKALDFSEKAQPITYKKYDGFNLWIDHVVDIARFFDITYCTVEVYDALGDRHEIIKTMTQPL